MSRRYRAKDVLDELRRMQESSGGPIARMTFLVQFGSDSRRLVRRVLAQLLREGRVRRVKFKPPIWGIAGYELGDVLTQMARAAKRK